MTYDGAIVGVMAGAHLPPGLPNACESFKYGLVLNVHFYREKIIAAANGACDADDEGCLGLDVAIRVDVVPAPDEDPEDEGCAPAREVSRADHGEETTTECGLDY